MRESWSLHSIITQLLHILMTLDCPLELKQDIVMNMEMERDLGRVRRIWELSEPIKDVALSSQMNSSTALLALKILQRQRLLIEKFYASLVGNFLEIYTTVVDPQNPIVSSNEVPPQQWEKMKKKLLINLLLVLKRLRVTVPKDVLLKIADYAKIGFTWEEALEHRKKLMKERKYFTDYMNVTMEREYSLCEH